MKSPMTDASTTAVLITIILILSKVIEGLWRKYRSGRSENGNGNGGRSESESKRQIREMYEDFIVFKRDLHDMKKNNERIAEALVQVSDCMRRVAESNEKVAELVERIDRRQEVEDEVRFREALKSAHHVSSE